MKLSDEVGKRYGKLVVLKRTGTKAYKSGQSKPLWSCQCDRGNVVETLGANLRNGTTKSCGCAKFELARDWVGVEQGNIKVIARAPDRIRKGGAKVIEWLCECSCGNSKVITTAGLKGGASCCGCGFIRGTHGHTVDGKPSPTFKSWHSMIQRCCNENNHAYPEYGGAGVTVHEPWKEFSNFLRDMGERPEGTSLNRINGANSYSPETCEWATLSVQSYDQKIRNTNTSGRTGVSFNKLTNKWEAYIDVNYKRIRLGHHEAFDKAVKAREEAELKYFGWIKQ